MSNKEYWKIRTDKIRKELPLRKLVDYFNVECKSEGEVTQIHCPFHGNDNHASARIYDTNTMYCWVCSKKWDVISFMKDFKNIKSFSETCKLIEDTFNIEKPSLELAYQEPSFENFLEERDILKEKDFDKEFKKLSNILIRNRDKLSLGEYSKYFYYLDSLYGSYKLNQYENDISLSSSINNLYKEIVKIT